MMATPSRLGPLDNFWLRSKVSDKINMVDKIMSYRTCPHADGVDKRSLVELPIEDNNKASAGISVRKLKMMNSRQ